MNRAALRRLALALAWMSAAWIAGLLISGATGALPAAVGASVLSAAQGCFKPHDRLRVGWLLLGLSAVVAGVAALSFGSAHPLSVVCAPPLLCAGVWQIHGGLSRSPLAASLPAAWRIAAMGAGLACTAPLALDGGPAWPVKVAAIAPAAATAFLAVRLLGFAVPLHTAGRPSVWLAASAVILAAASATGFVALPGLLDRLGWTSLGLAAWSVREVRHASLARLTSAREDVILRTQRARRGAATPNTAPDAGD